MSIKKNFLYSCILAVSTYVFPLLVYPYVSSTLGLTNIGIVNFIDNIINYFVLVSMMGITTVGVREIAANKNDIHKVSNVFVSLFSLTMVTTLISIIGLLIAMYTVKDLFPYRDLLYVGMIKLFFNMFLVEWLFKGLEDFKYITNRSLFVKCLYIALIFLFVRSASDYKLYFTFSVSMVAVNALINFFYCRNILKISFTNISIKPYLPPFLLMGVYFLFTNIYTSFNAVWLGLATNTDEVGYFTTATKLHVIIMSILASFTSVLFPRVSCLLSEGNKEEYWQKISMSLDAIFLFSFPIVVLLLVAGPDILHIIVGDGFEGAYTPLRLISPLVLIIGIEQILVIQILLAMHADRIVLIGSVIGALVSALLNFLFVDTWGAMGSSFAWLGAECSIMLMSLFYCKKYYKYEFPYLKFLVYMICYGIMCFMLYMLYTNLECHVIVKIAITMLVMAFCVFVSEVYILKNPVALLCLSKRLK